jgi:membrane-associated phospholipid phosphatase
VATADRRGDAWARRASVQDDDALRHLANVGDFSGKYGAMGIGPAMWVAGRVRGDSGTAVLGLRTSEAVVLSGVTIGILKAVSGRSRPYASAGNSPGNWDLFGGLRSDSTRSFASGHSALSAAAAVTLAAEWRRQGTQGWQTVGPPLVYSLAGVAAGSRVRDRQHWLSDVVTGSAIGMLSAVVVRRWHDAHPRSRIDRSFLRR